MLNILAAWAKSLLPRSGFVQQGPSSGQKKASRLLLAQKPHHFFLPLMGGVMCSINKALCAQ